MQAGGYGLAVDPLDNTLIAFITQFMTYFSYHLELTVKAVKSRAPTSSKQAAVDLSSSLALDFIQDLYQKNVYGKVLAKDIRHVMLIMRYSVALANVGPPQTIDGKTVKDFLTDTIAELGFNAHEFGKEEEQNENTHVHTWRRLELVQDWQVRPLAVRFEHLHGPVHDAQGCRGSLHRFLFPRGLVGKQNGRRVAVAHKIHYFRFLWARTVTAFSLWF